MTKVYLSEVPFNEIKIGTKVLSTKKDKIGVVVAKKLIPYCSNPDNVIVITDKNGEHSYNSPDGSDDNEIDILWDGDSKSDGFNWHMWCNKLEVVV